VSEEEWNANALVGTRVGTCVLERPLGVGGMCAVYLARQTRPRRQVAVKLLRPRTTADPREWRIFLARFRREADATAALDHANIVPIYEFGEDGTLAYLVMPYLPDGSLGELVAREGPLPVGLAISYLEQAAAALECAHQHGIIHRDVKPSNLLVHPDGRLLLADFGIARPSDKDDLIVSSEDGSSPGEEQDAGLTQAGVAMGTPEYMAPEQIRGEPISPATDIYALGMVTYAILTGHTPFAGGDTARIMARQIKEPPKPLRALRPDVPIQVERAALWALAKNPVDRPPSAPAFARALVSGRAATGALTPERVLPAGMGRAAEPGATSSPGRPRLSLGLRLSASPPVDDPDMTIHDVVPRGAGYHATPDGMPVWPGGDPQTPNWRGRGPILGCLAAVALLVAIVVVAANAAGWLESLTGAPATSSNSAANHATPIATATPTPSPTPTPTLPANWLEAQPGQVTLDCHRHKQVTITLTNLGNKHLGWSVNVQNTSFGGVGWGINIGPTQGSLDAGRSANVTVKNTSQIASHQGTITFEIYNNPDAGQPPQVDYQTIPCGFSG
jgi:serine/threonine protein kinase